MWVYLNGQRSTKTCKVLTLSHTNIWAIKLTVLARARYKNHQKSCNSKTQEISRIVLVHGGTGGLAGLRREKSLLIDNLSEIIIYAFFFYSSSFFLFSNNL